MLVRECYTEIRRDEDGVPYEFHGERMIEMPDVVTAEAQAIVDAQNAQAAQTATANETTIGQQLDAALMANQQAITALVAWRTTGPGAGTTTLTTAQLSPAMRTAADNQVAFARQLNGLIRLIRRNLSTADLNQGVNKPAAPLS